MHQLPVLGDGVDRTPDQQGLDIGVDQMLDRGGAVGKGRAAESVQARLGGFDLDSQKVDARRGGGNGSYITDGGDHGMASLF